MRHDGRLRKHSCISYESMGIASGDALGEHSPLREEGRQSCFHTPVHQAQARRARRGAAKRRAATAAARPTAWTWHARCRSWPTTTAAGTLWSSTAGHVLLRVTCSKACASACCARAACRARGRVGCAVAMDDEFDETQQDCCCNSCFCCRLHEEGVTAPGSYMHGGVGCLGRRGREAGDAGRRSKHKRCASPSSLWYLPGVTCVRR